MTAGEDDRDRLARTMLRLLSHALPPDGAVDLRMAGAGAGAIGIGRTVVLLASPDAVDRLLWPHAPTSLAEAYLRQDLEIESSIDAAVDAGERFDLGRLGWAERRRRSGDG